MKKENIKKKNGEEKILIEANSRRIAKIITISLFVIGIAVVNLVGFYFTSKSETMSFGGYLANFVFPAFFKIISLPFTEPQMFWLIIPLLISLLFMEIYFGRWKNEKIGWNSAFANFIVLLFVTINLLHFLWERYSSMTLVPFSVIIKFILVFIIMTHAALLMVVLYLHALPKKLSFFVGSPIIINLLAFLTIILVYSDISINFAVLNAAILIYIVLALIFVGVKSIIPPSLQAKEYLKERERKIEKEEKILDKLKKKNKKGRENLVEVLGEKIGKLKQGSKKKALF